MSSKNLGIGFPQPVFLRGARAINRKTKGHGTSNVVLPNKGCGPSRGDSNPHRRAKPLHGSWHARH